MDIEEIGPSGSVDSQELLQNRECLLGCMQASASTHGTLDTVTNETNPPKQRMLCDWCRRVWQERSEGLE